MAGLNIIGTLRRWFSAEEKEALDKLDGFEWFKPDEPQMLKIGKPIDLSFMEFKKFWNEEDQQWNYQFKWATDDMTWLEDGWCYTTTDVENLFNPDFFRHLELDYHTYKEKLEKTS